jgi:hypothetical protein
MIVQTLAAGDLFTGISSMWKEMMAPLDPVVVGTVVLFVVVTALAVGHGIWRAKKERGK